MDERRQKQPGTCAAGSRPRAWDLPEREHLFYVFSVEKSIPGAIRGDM